MNSPHKRSVTRKIFPFDDVIMIDVSKEVIGEQIKGSAGELKYYHYQQLVLLGNQQIKKK